MLQLNTTVCGDVTVVVYHARNTLGGVVQGRPAGLKICQFQIHTGFIHEVMLENHLASHEHPESIEFYLCGPPMMIKACNKMLAGLGVKDEQIAFDEF